MGTWDPDETAEDLREVLRRNHPELSDADLDRLLNGEPKRRRQRPPLVEMQITEYRLSILPEDHVDCEPFVVYVRWRGQDRWAVEWMSQCLGIDGRWDLTRTHRYLDMNAREPWLAAHRFDFDTALRLATEVLPTITVNGKTAADVLAKEAVRG